MGINIYCDESCHLEHDGQEAMVLGALWCSSSQVQELASKIKDLKTRHGLGPWRELKWTKVSPAKLDFYRDLICLFFETNDLNFRGLIVPNKSILDHKRFNQDHDTWYYKMFFELLKVLIQEGNAYRIFLDIKDTRSSSKIQKLRDVLSVNMGDVERNAIRVMQSVPSKEVQPMQLADLFIGAVSHASRYPDGSDTKRSTAKREIITMIQQKSGHKLTESTPRWATKFNLLRWRPSQGVP